MQQWADDTLVAIWQNNQGRYKVVELPARRLDVFPSRRSFRTEEQAEDYIREQYEDALRVQYEDIQEERERRQARQQPDQEDQSHANPEQEG